MGLIWFSRVFTDFHSILIRFYFVRPGFIGFCFDFRDLTDCLPGCTVFLTDYLWVLLGFFLVGLGFDGFFIQFSRLFTGPFIDDKESDQLGASTRSKQKQKKGTELLIGPCRPAGNQSGGGGSGPRSAHWKTHVSTEMRMKPTTKKLAMHRATPIQSRSARLGAGFSSAASTPRKARSSGSAHSAQRGKEDRELISIQAGLKALKIESGRYRKPLHQTIEDNFEQRGFIFNISNRKLPRSTFMAGAAFVHADQIFRLLDGDVELLKDARQEEEEAEEGDGRREPRRQRVHVQRPVAVSQLVALLADRDQWRLDH